MAKKLIVILSIGLMVLAPSAQAASKVTVFAASSLSESFAKLGKSYEKSHPGVKIVFSFHASNTLIQQITAGAPANILVSAEAFVGGSNYLANHVVIGVPKASAIDSPIDLNKIKWIQCAHVIPCGIAADNALVNSGITSKPISLEPKASSVLAKLKAGEVDAAIVYNTDVIANAKTLKAIEFPALGGPSTIYQIGLIKKNKVSQSFIDFLQSNEVLKFLKSRGFESI